MSFSETERYVFIGNLSIDTQPSLAPSPRLVNVLRHLEEKFRLNEAKEYHNEKGALVRAEDYGNDDVCRKLIYIADMEIDEVHGRASILVNYGDRDAPDPAFANFENHHIRDVGKEEGEGVAFSAHLVINLGSLPHNPDLYRATMEKVPYVSRSKVIQFINRVLRSAAQFHQNEYRFNDPETNSVKHYYPKLSFDMQPNTTLRESLVNGGGELKLIDLVEKSYGQDDYDEDGYTKVNSRRISLKIERASIGDRAVELLRAVKLKAAEDGFSSMYIRYTVGDDEQSASIPTSAEDAADVLFARMELTDGYNEPLKQCADHIVDEVVEKMGALLDNQRLWR